jgi:hypothetical protein
MSINKIFENIIKYIRKAYCLQICLFHILVFISCNDSPTSPIKQGVIIVDSTGLNFDADLKEAIRYSIRDSSAQRMLWSKKTETTIYPDHSASSQSYFTEEIQVRISNDSIFISDCQNSITKEGNIVLAGYCHKLTVHDNTYTFSGKRWSDVVEVNSGTEYEYSPFYLKKKNYTAGDTLKGRFTIKETVYRNQKVNYMIYHSYAINAIVESIK